MSAVFRRNLLSVSETPAMAVALKTRERIVLESLALFNAEGERAITTNHIAAHLGISPGNLYYHFRNKQAIIAELFAQYERQVAQFLQRPAGRALTVADKTYYLEALLAAMWHYRFLHRDLEHLLDSDSELAARYRLFAGHCLQQAQAIYQGFVEAGILVMQPEEIEALTLNSWIILTSWVRFLCSMRPDDAPLSEELLRRGIYQVLALESGYVSPAARDEVRTLQARLHVPLSAVLP